MTKKTRTTCSDCGKEYDIMLSRCPDCRRPNDERPATRMLYIPIPHQISVFLIGLIGLNLLAVIYTLIFSRATEGDSAYRTLVVNSMTYITLFIVDIIVLMKYFADFGKPFLKGRTYLAGLIGFAAVYGASFIVALITSVAFPDAGTGENQSVAIQMVLKNPAVCIIVLGLIGPLVEEVAYRVGLFSLCKRWSTVFAYIVTIIVFAAIHIDFFSKNITDELIALPSYLLAAGIFTTLYHLEGFGAAYIAHALNNLLSVVMIIVTQGK